MSIERFHVGKRLSEMVVHGNTIYLAGQVAEHFAEDGKAVLPALWTGQATGMGGRVAPLEEMRAERMSLQQASFEKQQDRIAHLQKFIDRFKAKASKAKQAQSRVKALARMEFVPVPE